MENSNMVSTSPANVQESFRDKCGRLRLYSYLKFLRVSNFIMFLIMIHAWLENSIATILITHLTGEGWRLPVAASIVNVQDGISAFLLLVVAILSNYHKMGTFRTVVLTNIVYLIGLVLIYIGARKEVDILSPLFIAAICIAVGRSGRDISLKQFLADQCKAEWSLNDDDEIENRRQIYWRIASICGVVVSICFTWIYDIELAELSMISAIAMAVGFAFFLAGIPFYHDFKLPERESESAASRLLLAARKKKHLPHTCSSSTSAASENRHVYMDMALRWVNKAAIVEPSMSIEEQLRRGRLYTVERVRDVKNMLSLIPLWSTFLVYGLLQATASVFFYEQVIYMDPQFGVIPDVPIALFAVITSSTSFVVSYFSEKWFPSSSKDGVPRRGVMLIRIGVGLAIAPVCCVIAWRVESHRLEKYVKADVVIDVVWLIPQFLLLGVLEGLVSDGMEGFFNANVSKSFKKYGPAFTEFAPDIGHFLSLALVLNLRSLFGDDLNMSSLGLYYAILSYVCFVNFMFYCFVATHFVKRQEGENYPQDEEVGNQDEEREGQEMEELMQNVADINLDDEGNHEQEGELYDQDEEREGQEMEEMQNVAVFNQDDEGNHAQEGDQSYAQGGEREGQEINLDDEGNYEQEGESYALDEEREVQGVEELQNRADFNPDDEGNYEQKGESYAQDEEREVQGVEELQNRADINPDDAGNQEQVQESYAQEEEGEGQEVEKLIQNRGDINLDDAGNLEQDGESYAQDEEREVQGVEELQNVADINPDDAGNLEQEGESYAQDEERYY